MFLETIRAFAAILAAVTALLGLYFGVTRAARLRRREQLFRESLTALNENDPRRRSVSELHRVTLADLIARQMTGSWRTAWPWLAWFIIAVLYGQLGYLGAAYLASDAPWSVFDFFLATTGDGFATPILMVGAIFAIFPQIYRSYVWTLSERARIAQRFYDGESVEPPAVLLELELAAEMKGLKSHASREEVTDKTSKERSSDGQGRGLWSYYGKSLIPGLFCISSGLFVGTQFWITRQPGDRLETVESLRGFFLLTLLFFVLTIYPTASIWFQVVKRLRQIAPGGKHPETPARVRTELGRRASRHGVQSAPRRVAGPVKRPEGPEGPEGQRSRRPAPRQPGRRRLRWPARLRWRRPGRR
ncbi:hypothetical protein [Modestobacter altitudinis]|uniref:hypothetical protein n=1 Tax=Modestobacter altitudinis TaxID=2213158 RepID=UPI00110CC023|nr:hypothetical protein [Modestobacter altitudinis]